MPYRPCILLSIHSSLPGHSRTRTHARRTQWSPSRPVYRLPHPHSAHTRNPLPSFRTCLFIPTTLPFFSFPHPSCIHPRIRRRIRFLLPLSSVIRAPLRPSPSRLLSGRLLAPFSPALPSPSFPPSHTRPYLLPYHPGHPVLLTWKVFPASCSTCTALRLACILAPARCTASPALRCVACYPSAPSPRASAHLASLFLSLLFKLGPNIRLSIHHPVCYTRPSGTTHITHNPRSCICIHQDKHRLNHPPASQLQSINHPSHPPTNPAPVA